jgi:hypothetical protein
MIILTVTQCCWLFFKFHSQETAYRIFQTLLRCCSQETWKRKRGSGEQKLRTEGKYFTAENTEKEEESMYPLILFMYYSDECVSQMCLSEAVIANCY